MQNRDFIPKLFTLVKEGIPREQLIKDIMAGFIVGIVALPLAIAFAIASGVSPEKGIITAFIAGFIVSFLGGSRVQIGGPTGAFIVIVFGIIRNYGIQGLTIATFIAGFLLIIMGILQFGRLLKYFPYTLIVGFTTGIAVTIFSSQVKDFFGLQMDTVPAEFLEKWIQYFRYFDSINWISTGIGVFTVLTVIFFPKLTKKIPGSLAAIVLSTLIVYFLKLPVETIGSKFGTIHSLIPKPQFYLLDFKTMQNLIQPAFAIAILGAIESLLSATVADGMTGGKHRPNMELIAQGIANIFSGMFGGIPATGAIARTSTNIKNGGRTPVSGIIHSITLFIIMVAASPLAGYIPLSCLAGILFIVAWNMSEIHIFIDLLKFNRYDSVVLISTFIITVVFDLVLAIEVGMILAAFLFIKRMTETTGLTQILQPENSDSLEKIFEEELGNIPESVVIFEIEGPLFFGAAQVFSERLKNIGKHYEFLILRMRNVTMIDATGMHRLREIVKLMEHRQIHVILSGVNRNVEDDILRHEILVKERIKESIADALECIRGLGTVR